MKIKPRVFAGTSDIPAAEREEIEVAFASPDLVRMGAFAPFFDLVETLPGLRWLHLGFAGIDNPLFYLDRTLMLFADAGDALQGISREVREA